MFLTSIQIQLVAKNLIFVLTLVLICIPTKAQVLQVNFVIRNAGLSVDGTFTESKIEYEFDTQNVAQAYFNASVQIKSIDTGIKARDRHLLKDKYFNVERFPQMSFTSTKVEKGDLGFWLEGNLTIKGVTQFLILPLELDIVEEEGTYLKTEFTIDRRDFEVGKNHLILGDEVTVKLSLKL